MLRDGELVLAALLLCVVIVVVIIVIIVIIVTIITRTVVEELRVLVYSPSSKWRQSYPDEFSISIILDEAQILA